MKLAILLTVVGLVVVGVAALVIFYPWEPRPSGRFSVEPIRVGKDIATLVEMPSGPGDGGEDVRAAVQNYFARFEEIRRQRSARTGDVKELTEQIDAIESAGVSAGTVLPFTCSKELLAAAGKGEFTFPEALLEDVTLEWRMPMRLLYALEYVATTAILEGDIAAKRGRREQAEQIYQAVLIYGRRLADSQVRVWIQFEGLTAQFHAARALAALWQESDAAKAQAALDYARAIDRALEDKTRLVGALCNHVNKWNAGDLLLFARRHSEPAWRVEAMLAMGMARLNPSAQKHNKALMRYLAKARDDENPWVAKAARWSHDLTLEVYRVQTTTVD